MRFCFWVCFPFVFFWFGVLYFGLIFCSWFFVWGLVYWAEVSMWRVRHWARGLRAVARHWGGSMPSKFASLPSIVDMGLFFLGWFIGLSFRWLHHYGQCRVFFRGGGIFGAMGDGLDLTLLGGSESGVREVE
jgi:hypothetical protein